MDTEAAVEADIERFFDSRSSSDTFDSFNKDILSCNGIDNVTSCASELVQLLQLGKLEKGAASTASKYNSRSGRWFSQKASGESTSDIAGDGGSQCATADAGGELYITRNSLVQLNCKRGSSTFRENYTVRSLITCSQIL